MARKQILITISQYGVTDTVNIGINGVLHGKVSRMQVRKEIKIDI